MRVKDTPMHATTHFKDYRAVLNYTEENGRKLKKTKLFDDIRKGRLKKQPDGTFRQRDVDRYMASLPMAGTPDIVAEKAADRQRRREEADIRKAEASAAREEFDLAVKQGQFVQRARVHLELAARAATLSAGLKTAFEARHLDLVALVDGNPKKGAALVEKLEALLDEALNEYSREMEFEVAFEAAQADAPEQEDAEA